MVADGWWSMTRDSDGMIGQLVLQQCVSVLCYLQHCVLLSIEPLALPQLLWLDRHHWRCLSSHVLTVHDVTLLH
jgi:hypothetical protein